MSPENTSGGQTDKFSLLMHRGQVANSRSDFEASKNYYTQAADIAPNNLHLGRAIRGIASPTFRLEGYDQAVDFAQQAFAIHDQLVEASEPANKPEITILRERAQSATVLGTFALGEYCRIHLDNANRKHTVAEIVAIGKLRNKTLGMYAVANDDLEYIELRSSQTDQHRINLAARHAAAVALFISESEGLELAKQALFMGFESESPDLKTSNPDLETKDRLLAKGRAVFRGFQATRVARLASPINHRKRIHAMRLIQRWIV